MTFTDVALTIGTSAAVSFLVTCRGTLRALLPLPRPKPLDPQQLDAILRSAGTLTRDRRPPAP